MAGKHRSFAVSEWEWLKLQLRLHAVEYRAEIFSEYYDFKDPGKVTCKIFAKQVQEMMDKKASKTEQLEYYKDWVEGVKRNIQRTLELLPGLRKSFNMKSDLTIRIMHHYGMGGSLICEFVGDKINWSKTTEQQT